MGQHLEIKGEAIKYITKSWHLKFLLVQIPGLTSLGGGLDESQSPSHLEHPSFSVNAKAGCDGAQWPQNWYLPGKKGTFIMFYYVVHWKWEGERTCRGNKRHTQDTQTHSPRHTQRTWRQLSQRDYRCTHCGRPRMPHLILWALGTHCEKTADGCGWQILLIVGSGSRATHGKDVVPSKSGFPQVWSTGSWWLPVASQVVCRWWNGFKWKHDETTMFVYISQICNVRLM